MNFEVTYWGSRPSVDIGKITLVRGKPTLVDEATYADIYRHFPHDIEAKLRGSARWHYQAPRLKTAAAQVKVDPVVAKPVVVEPPKTEPTVTVVEPAPVEAIVDDVVVVDVTTAEVVEPEMSDLTLEERIANLIPESPADVITQIADELVSGSATQDSIMALAGVKARIAKRILKLVGG